MDILEIPDCLQQRILEPRVGDERRQAAAHEGVFVHHLSDDGRQVWVKVPQLLLKASFQGATLIDVKRLTTVVTLTQQIGLVRLLFRQHHKIVDQCTDREDVCLRADLHIPGDLWRGKL